jgi:hypothetical protein
MYLAMHGGHCCGMSHIYGFVGGGSGILLPELKAKDTVKLDDNGTTERIRYIRQYPHMSQIYDVNRPKETAKERLIGYIKHVTDFRRRGIIEVVLAGSQIDVWRATLEELGFKEVNRHINSNSGRMLFIFHLNTGDQS